MDPYCNHGSRYVFSRTQPICRQASMQCERSEATVAANFAPRVTCVPSSSSENAGSYVDLVPSECVKTTTGLPATLPEKLRVPGSVAYMVVPGAAVKSIPRCPACQFLSGGSKSSLIIPVDRAVARETLPANLVNTGKLSELRELLSPPGGSSEIDMGTIAIEFVACAGKEEQHATYPNISAPIDSATLCCVGLFRSVLLMPAG